MSEDWWEDAACKDTDTAAFFPEQGTENHFHWALRICSACPVREPCLQWSIDHHEMHGVWGGLSAHQRKPLMATRPRVQQRDACNAGHSFLDPDNYRVRLDGKRYCLVCWRERRAA